MRADPARLNVVDTMSARDVIANLRALAARTSDGHGAQRVAWGPVWRDARRWLDGLVSEHGLRAETDLAGNRWITVPGTRPETVIIGGHLDSVPNGGWLDGALGVLAGIEALRRFTGAPPPVTLAVVDFADEEGARFSRSLLGSSGASGSLIPDSVRGLVDRQGVRLPEALAENGVDLDRMLEARPALDQRHPRAYLELHIEQGPVLEAKGRSTGVVIGTYGVERHVLRFVGQAAHSGLRPSRCAVTRSSRPPKLRWAVATLPAATRRTPSGWCAQWALCRSSRQS